MAKCPSCGKLTLRETLCDDCKGKQTAHAIIDELKRRLQVGQIIYLYETVYLSVDSVLMGEKIGNDFEISTIRKLGLDGWEVTQSIPKTMGVGLSNHVVGFSAGESWGGGSGGNISGVYIILKKVLRSIDDLTQWGKLDSYIQNYIGDFTN